MSHMKNEHLLTEITIHDGNRSLGRRDVQPNLNLLAEQLVAIANQLQQTSLGQSNSLSEKEAAAKANLLDRLAASELLPHEGSASFGEPKIGQDDTAASNLSDTSINGFQAAGNKRRDAIALARSAYSNRRARNAIFGNAELFGEPAWDILLDLYIAHGSGKPVSVSSACIGSASPPTTGLRWLGVLADNDLVLREHDAEDQRRVLVRLTDKGLAAMDEYFSSAGGSN